MSENTDTDDAVADLEPVEGRDDKRAALDAERATADALSDGDIVEQRTADTDETKAARKVADDEHVKVFVVPPGNKPGGDYDHEPNIAATRQYMMSQGLRPTSAVRFVGAEPFGPGGKSWALTYAVSAVPAERFDFAEVHVIQGEGGAAGEAPGAGASDDEAGSGDEAPKPPTMSSNRKAIDEWGAQIDPPIDTTGAETKRAALALLGITE